MKILSWNVNGLRARYNNGIINTINTLNPDIYCLQEVRARIDQISPFLNNMEDKYSRYYLSRHEKPGYAGVLAHSKFNDLTHELSFDGNSELGREVILEFDNFILLSVYSPNAGQNLEKIENRAKWEIDLFNFVAKCAKPVIICGDMNVAPEKIDCNVRAKAGVSPVERYAFKNLKDTYGLIDVYRELNPDKQEFTWHSYINPSLNKGMRIDHFLVSKELKDKIKGMEIISNPDMVCGSDHTLILLDIDI